MCALAPVHAVIPADIVGGATLQSDGSIEFYGYNALFLPQVAIRDITIDQPRIPPYQWSISPDGRLLSKSELDFPAAGWFRSVDAVSQDGSWLAGVQTSETGDVILNGKTVVWRRGTNDLIPLELSPGQYGPIVRGLSNEGDVLFTAYVGSETASFVRDRTGVLLALPSLYPPEASTGPGTSPVFVNAISADGRTIVGISGGGGIPGALPPRATIWKNGIAQELPAGGYSQSFAGAVSDDGRIVGGSVGDGTTARAAVWVDGVLQQSLADDPHGTLVLQVVNGVGGDPAAWAALGYDWIARSDGVVRSLDSGFFEPYGLSLTGSNRPVKLLANEDALYLVTLETPSGFAAGFNFYSSGKLAAHVLVLPTDYTYSQIDALDLSGDHRVSLVDALLVINALNEHPNASLIDLPGLRQALPKIDTNGDGELSLVDALRIINYLNEPATASPNGTATSGEGEGISDSFTAAADEYFLTLGERKRRK